MTDVPRTILGFAVAGMATGISFFLCSLIDRSQREAADVRRQVGDIAAGIMARESKAAEDRKAIMDEITEQAGVAEKKRTEILGRVDAHNAAAAKQLRRVEGALRAIEAKVDGLARAGGAGGPASIPGRPVPGGAGDVPDDKPGDPMDMAPGDGDGAIEGGWPDAGSGLASVVA